LKILLHTSAYSALHRGDRRILNILRRAELVAVPTIVLGELHSGFQLGTRRIENEELLRQFLNRNSVQVANITAETALRYADIDVLLRKKGRPIPRNDVWIAALAIEHGMHLLTLDEHFREIPMLYIEPLPNELL
jgi:predicted nucleic acid-binding protein